MPSRPIPETIEKDWDRFYLEFPDVYDRFAVTSVAVMPTLRARYGLKGTILDVASGTGKSTFALTEHAHRVIGLEPWSSMLDYAAARQRGLGVTAAPAPPPATPTRTNALPSPDVGPGTLWVAAGGGGPLRTRARFTRSDPEGTPPRRPTPASVRPKRRSGEMSFVL